MTVLKIGLKNCTYVPIYTFWIELKNQIKRLLQNMQFCSFTFPLLWRHNGHSSVSNHQPHDCLLNGLLRRRSKLTSKLRITGLCVGNAPGPVNSPHKGPVTRKMFPFDDVIMHYIGISLMCVDLSTTLWWLLMSWCVNGTRASATIMLTWLCVWHHIINQQSYHVTFKEIMITIGWEAGNMLVSLLKGPTMKIQDF